MTEIHIYATALQSAVQYIDRYGAKNIRFRNPGNRLLHTECCRMNRAAKNLLVQCYYDAHYFWCKKGKGCTK